MTDSDQSKLKTILQSVRALSPIDRAELLERLYGTFESSDQQEIDQKWANEAEERLEAYRSGQLDAEPVQQVLNRLNTNTDS